MAITPIKALLVLLGGTAAATATAYLAGALDPFLSPPPASVASLPAPATPPLAAEQPKPEAQPAAVAPAAETPPAASASPSFDLVRVEPDGSLVIAGRAVANARVELLIGDQTIGEATAGADGDFAIVLDKPLEPGDYQISLRATPPGGTPATSPETAVVSVPKTPDGQVLAMVEAPGKPAEIITAPKVDAPAVAAAPSTPPAAEQPSAAASAPATEQPAQAAVTADKPADGQVAAAAPETKPAAETSPAVSAPAVRVGAVEIDGKKIFVAGVTEPGRTVRGYANEILLGDAKAAPDGSFLIEAERDLPVGNYMIRADVLDQNGGVVARAVVPFEREPGTVVAAVAAPEPASPATPQPAGTAPAAEAPAASQPAPSSPPANVATAPAPAAVNQPAVAAAPAPAAPAPAETASADKPAGETPPASAAAPSAQAEAPATPKPDVTAAAQAEQPAAAPAAPAQPEATAPKLQSVKSGVIIRRGDSLWRISRRVYGAGVRYSTIYLANQDQISNPNRIWPGQVFAVPETSQDGAPADMTRVGKQATTVQ